MIRNIVFDVGYVLIGYTWKKQFMDFGYDEQGVARLAGTLFGGGVDENSRSLWDRYDCGLATDEEVKQGCIERHPEDRMVLEWFFSHPGDWVEVLPDMAQLIPGLKEKGYRVYLLSNYPESLWHAHVDGQSFRTLADGAAVSWQEHVGKPDAAFFRRFLEKYSLRAEECLFLDDRRDNTLAARKLGFCVRTLDTPHSRAQAVRELSSLAKV